MTDRDELVRFLNWWDDQTDKGQYETSDEVVDEYLRSSGKTNLQAYVVCPSCRDRVNLFAKDREYGHYTKVEYGHHLTARHPDDRWEIPSVLYDEEGP